MSNPAPIPEWAQTGTVWHQMDPVVAAWAAERAGFTGNDVVTMVAISMAEAPGTKQGTVDPFAIGDKDIGGSYGLWQIYSKAHPTLFDNNAAWYSAEVNAKMAYQVYVNAGNKFTPWSTYKHDTYKKHLLEATAAVEKNRKNPNAVTDTLPPIYYAGQALGGGVGNSIGSALTSLDDLLALVNTILDFVSNGRNWIRIGEVVGGAILVVVAGFLLSNQGGNV